MPRDKQPPPAATDHTSRFAAAFAAARRIRNRSLRNATLDTVALLSEAWLRVRKHEAFGSNDRRALFIAIQAMERAAADYHRARNRDKRTGPRATTDDPDELGGAGQLGAHPAIESLSPLCDELSLHWEGASAEQGSPPSFMTGGTDLDLDVLAALTDLEKQSERSAIVARLWIYFGLTSLEMSQVLGTSVRTVESERRLVREFLHERLRSYVD